MVTPDTNTYRKLVKTLPSAYSVQSTSLVIFFQLFLIKCSLPHSPPFATALSKMPLHSNLICLLAPQPLLVVSQTHSLPCYAEWKLFCWGQPGFQSLTLFQWPTNALPTSQILPSCLESLTDSISFHRSPFPWLHPTWVFSSQ